MKNRIFSLVLAALILVFAVMPASAEDFFGASDWKVEFDGKELSSNFTTAEINDAIGELQPGDNITFNIELSTKYKADANWWMTNKVLDSFEDNSIAKGGAYTYVLTYIAPDGNDNVIYSSDMVGGEDIRGGEGLHEATDALEDYFFVDTIKTGKSAMITLLIELDGETQGNAYQDTLADLQMNFAVEVPQGKDSPPGPPDIVKTGDEFDLTLYIIIAAVSGAVLLFFAVWRVKRSKKQQRGDRA